MANEVTDDDSAPGVNSGGDTMKPHSDWYGWFGGAVTGGNG